MTINDLVDSGVIIQGAYAIKKWDDVIGVYNVLAEGQDFECESNEINEGFLDAEIKYIYASREGSCMVIEIE